MDPEELLAQIASLMQEYIALGGDTPLASEMPAMLAQVEAASGGGEEGSLEGGEIPIGDQTEPAMALAEAMGGAGEEVPGGEEMPTDFDGAQEAALANFKSTGSYGRSPQTKTGNPAQSEEEDPRRRRKAR